ncbi:virulence RhuM family protein [Algoriphagus ratkowskyi]|uniref:Virulence RhuM family protein n=1 Tax=Algoriphagus ratkowskyi TaxID=57028 RepID=A0A2W7RX57_9BACT|nr:RhuM family protein [Algoriphagus ratkowskyi]PZX55505.1 virulence RhuM family protein [Algoriphagus ratkowskyi]TXD79581.1 virulence RhuM family protein [Algoriphagus ratkowskyi]
MSEHIKNIFESEELQKDTTVRKFRTVQMEGKRTVERDRAHYNLDVIIAVGYRVNSKRGTQFRQWATQRLKDFLVQGYAIYENRLSQKHKKFRPLKTESGYSAVQLNKKHKTKTWIGLIILQKGLSYWMIMIMRTLIKKD